MFLWDDNEGRMRYHQMKQEDVKLPVKKGGLDLRSLTEMNVALQGK